MLNDIFLFSKSYLSISQKYVFLSLAMSIKNYDNHWSLSFTLIISFIVFVFFGIVQSAVLLFVQKMESTNITDVKLLAYSNLGLISFVSSILGSLLVLVFIRIKNATINSYLNLNLPNLKISVYFFLVTSVFIFFMEYVSRLYPDLFETDFVLESYKNANNLPLLYLGVVFLGPLFEEILFRGFLFKGLQRSFLGGTGAVIISSIIFSIIHIQYGFAVIVLLLFPMALLLGYARLKSNSLILPILLHSFNNLLTCIVTHFEVY